MAIHDPYKCNGLKYSHALPETTKKIEKCCTLVQSKDIKSVPPSNGLCGKE
jgi:hypothetical protein